MQRGIHTKEINIRMAKIIQVMGPSRTGTTMTHLMLANSKDAFACGEINAFFRPWRNHHFRPVCQCGNQYADCIWRKFVNTDESHFHSDLSHKLNVQWVVDESKNLRWVVDCQNWAMKTNMKIFNILMVKQPADLMYSYWKRGKPIGSVRKMLLSYYEKVLQLDIPIIAVDLIGLVNNPRKKLSNLCELIGMPYFEGKECFWEKPSCHLFGSLGVRKQIEKGDVVLQSTRDFPEEFLKTAKYELEVSSADKKLRRIYSILSEKEVERIDKYDGVPRPLTKRLYPFWYYRDVVWCKYRNHFPQKVSYLR